MFTACTGHTAILNNRIAERANLHAFIRPPALLLSIFTHLACFFHALNCPLIISALGFAKLFIINFIPYGRWIQVACNSGNGLCGDVLNSSTRWREKNTMVEKNQYLKPPPGGGIARLINMPKHGFLLHIDTYFAISTSGGPL